VASSPLVQATQESIESLHAAASAWGRVFETAPAGRAQLDAQADAIAAVYLAFNVAYGALPRFRTEPGLRRFMESLQELERAVRTVRIPSQARALDEVLSIVAQAVQQAGTAFATVSGKSPEAREAPRPVSGSVVKILGDRGYGFVRQTGSTAEVFFTAQNVRGARFGDLRIGQNVSFRVVPDARVPGRMQAIEVQPLP
jgi:cold shock CspA family protein